MKKLLFVPLLIASLLAAIPAFAAEGIAVIDMRNAVLATQVAQDAFKALEEETEYAANIERATLLQTERQAIAEKLQKDAETLSQEEIADMQRDIQEKGKDTKHSQVMAKTLEDLRFDNSYARLPETFYQRRHPTAVKEPKLIKLNYKLLIYFS